MDLYDDAIQKLCKWRVLLTGWQLGTRAKGDPEGDAVRDHREVTLLLRAEVNTLTTLLVKKGIVTVDEMRQATAEEAEFLCRANEKKFPGVKATESGLTFTFPEAAKTMRNWRP